MAVGSSANRTPIKHFLADTMIGQVVGAGSVMPSVTELFIFDCCGGDAVATEYSGTSSPIIFQKRLDQAHQRGLWAHGYVCERDAYTFERLKKTIGGGSVKLIHDDYRSPRVITQIVKCSANAVGFVNVDPNHAYEIDFPDHFLAILPERTMILVTLGCNVGGIKRLREEERLKVPERIEHVLKVRRPYHEACLVRLERDRAQWAYLLTTPRGWRNRTDKVIARLAKQHWPKGVRASWFGDSQSIFWQEIRTLFVTRQEEAHQCKDTSELNFGI